MTGRELLEISGSMYGMSRSSRERKIPEMLRLCGVEDAARPEDSHLFGRYEAETRDCTGDTA